MNALHIITFILTALGGLNWGLLGAANVNLVHTLVGSWPMVEKIVYIVIGLSAVYQLITHFSDCKPCDRKS